MEGEGRTCFLSCLHLQATCTEEGLTESTSLTLSQDWVTGEHSLPWTYQLPTKKNALIWASKVRSGTSSFLAMRFGHYAFIYNTPYLWMYQVFFFLLVLLRYNWHIVVQSPSHAQLLVTPWTATCQTTCSPISPRVCSNSCPLSQWCYLTISSSTTPFSFCLQSFPAFRVFSNELAKVLELQL